MIWTVDQDPRCWPFFHTGDAVVAYLKWHEFLGAFDWGRTVQDLSEHPGADHDGKPRS